VNYLSAISEDAGQKFFHLQGQRRVEKEYPAYDTTSVSSYSRCLRQVCYGRNKDHDPLPQINLAPYNSSGIQEISCLIRLRKLSKEYYYHVRW